MFLITVVVVLAFMALWNFDLHKLFRVRNIAQNGGDSAALMAARWQGITLNVVGDLNIMQALALAAGDTGTAAAITNIQARLLITGPMVALQASQQAAKNNGIFPNDSYSDFLRDHANIVRTVYRSISATTGEMICPEPYTGAWLEYADMLDLVANDGVAAGPDNMQLFFDSISGHMLFNAGFYDAVAGRNWCWFLRNAPSLLQDYTNFFPCWWSPLPAPPAREYLNSEFYGLKLAKIGTTLDSFNLTTDEIDTIAQERGFSGAMTTNALAIPTTWYVYSDQWGEWTAATATDSDGFPFRSPVKDKYFYSGADAAVRVEATTARYTPGPAGSTVSNTITWSSAAKPFGYLNDNDLPSEYDLVLPAYHDVRLIPIDTSSAPTAGGFNLDFRRHVDDHLPEYMQNGPSSLPTSCYYCRQLRTWENTAFRQSGVAWLTANSDRCAQNDGGGSDGGGGGGGGGGSGGRRRGH